MDTVNVSQKTARSLSKLNELTPEIINKICKYFLQSLVKGNSSIVIEENFDQYVGAISVLLLEAAKYSISTEQVKSIFADNGAEGEPLQIITALYDQHKQTIIDHIRQCGINAPNIVGIEWRLDYSIRSKNCGRENLPQYFVSLKLMDDGVMRNVDMMATIEELQDLLSKVKDAVKQVDRVLNMSSE